MNNSNGNVLSYRIHRRSEPYVAMSTVSVTTHIYHPKFCPPIKRNMSETVERAGEVIHPFCGAAAFGAFLKVGSLYSGSFST